MSKVLYIKANPKSDNESNTFKLSEKFIQAYKKANPDDEITTVDLYKEGIKPLSAENIAVIFSPNRDINNPVFKYANQFITADKIILAAPMWNLSIPSILKAYIDFITVAGITFKYTEEGPVGLCKGKKCIHLTTRGGLYSEGPTASYEMGDRYLRTIFGFLGIEKFETIAAEKLNIVGEDWEKIMENAMKKAEESAKIF